MRECVVDAIRHRRTDCTPWNIELTAAFADRLRAQTGCADPEAFLDNCMTRVKCKSNSALGNGEELDLFGVKWSKSKNGGDVGIVTDSPIKEASFGNYIGN